MVDLFFIKINPTCCSKAFNISTWPIFTYRECPCGWWCWRCSSHPPTRHTGPHFSCILSFWLSKIDSFYIKKNLLHFRGALKQKLFQKLQSPDIDWREEGSRAYLNFDFILNFWKVKHLASLNGAREGGGLTELFFCIKNWSDWTPRERRKGGSANFYFESFHESPDVELVTFVAIDVNDNVIDLIKLLLVARAQLFFKTFLKPILYFLRHFLRRFNNFILLHPVLATRVKLAVC